MQMPQSSDDCMVVELRQYTLHPGMRDRLIDLFDREFVETQEAAGITVYGQFRDLDDPNQFVWLRGFRDMPARAAALSAFYGGAAWKSHKDEANATMIDSDDVLMLRPARQRSGFQSDGRMRPSADGTAVSSGLFTVSVHYPEPGATSEFVAFFERAVAPELTAAGASLIGYFVTEHSTNNFPALPVREGEHVFVVVSRFADQRAYEDQLSALSRSADWSREISARLQSRLLKPSDVRRLAPTARSSMRA